jgi:hypothetical protein
MKLKAYLAFSCAAVFPSWWVSGFPHRDAQSQGMDLEAAKREGELVSYSATRAEDTDQLVKAFTKKYPFIKGSYYRTGGDPRFERILTEAKSEALSGEHFNRETGSARV